MIHEILEDNNNDYFCSISTANANDGIVFILLTIAI